MIRLNSRLGPDLPCTGLISRKWGKRQPIVMASSDANRFKSVTVFCGSSSGASPRYAEAAQELGAELCRRGIALVYGGRHAPEFSPVKYPTYASSPI